MPTRASAAAACGSARTGKPTSVGRLPKGTTIHVSVEADGPFVRFFRGKREFTPDDPELPRHIEQAVRYRPDGQLAVVVSELGPALAQLHRIRLKGAKLYSPLLSR